MQKAVFIGADPQVVEIARLAICLRWPDVTPSQSNTGTGGLEMVKEQSPDLVLIKPDFPDKTLTQVIRELRGFSNVPLVVLNYQTNELERVTALEAGADEYFQLPCELSELTFKIWSLMRRTAGAQAVDDRGTLVGGELTVDLATHEVFLGSDRVALTPVEFQLTQILVKNSGSVVSRSTIENELSRAGLGTVGSVKQHVMRLRRKFGDDARNPKWIANVPGVGYRFIGGPSADGGPSKVASSRRASNQKAA